MKVILFYFKGFTQSYLPGFKTSQRVGGFLGQGKYHTPIVNSGNTNRTLCTSNAYKMKVKSRYLHLHVILTEKESVYYVACCFVHSSLDKSF